MAAVYSSQLLVCPIGETGIETFTVPAGYIAIVRDITIRLTSSGPTYVVDCPDPEFALSIVTEVDPETGVAHLDCRIVMLAGQVIRAYDATASGNGSAVISGYLLVA